MRLIKWTLSGHIQLSLGDATVEWERDMEMETASAWDACLGVDSRVWVRGRVSVRVSSYRRCFLFVHSEMQSFRLPQPAVHILLQKNRERCETSHSATARETCLVVPPCASQLFWRLSPSLTSQERCGELETL